MRTIFRNPKKAQARAGADSPTGYFALLNHEEQKASILKMKDAGYGPATIAGITGMHPRVVDAILSAHTASVPK